MFCRNFETKPIEFKDRGIGTDKRKGKLLRWRQESEDRYNIPEKYYNSTSIVVLQLVAKTSKLGIVRVGG
jgi:hypothetical protein